MHTSSLYAGRGEENRWPRITARYRRNWQGHPRRVMLCSSLTLLINKSPCCVVIKSLTSFFTLPLQLLLKKQNLSQLGNSALYWYLCQIAEGKVTTVSERNFKDGKFLVLSIVLLISIDNYFLQLENWSTSIHNTNIGVLRRRSSATVDPGLRSSA